MAELRPAAREVRRERAVESLRRDRLRIALLTYRGNPNCGGQGVYTRHLARALVEEGHVVTVFSGQPYPEVTEGVELVRVPSLDLYREPDPFRAPRRREFESLADCCELALMRAGGFPEPRTFGQRVRRVIAAREEAFDVIHDNQSLSNAVAHMHSDGWPVLASIHHPITIDRALDLASEPRRWRRLAIRRWYGFARMQRRVAASMPRILTVSESSRTDIAREFSLEPSRIAVVPVGVDTDVFRPLPMTARVRGRILTTASADVALKGLVYLIEALVRIRSTQPEAHLVVIGRPKDNSPVLAAIDRLGLRFCVQFLSGLSEADIAAQYARTSCAVVPSLYEGFSLPAVEAMACGAPLVTTTGGALPEVVGTDGSCALLVPPADADALAAAVGHVLSTRSLGVALGAEGVRRVHARFSWEQCARDSVKEYQRLLEEFVHC